MMKEIELRIREGMPGYDEQQKIEKLRADTLPEPIARNLREVEVTE